MLSMTGVDALLPVHATAAEAVASMSAGQPTSTDVHCSVTSSSTDGYRELTEGKPVAFDNDQGQKATAGAERRSGLSGQAEAWSEAGLRGPVGHSCLRSHLIW
ncbi:hypothetical protein [Streptomyces tibetensis]|uniref:hypothetical protein n=1 Tax=Streptomyces tibetensis TaxID=2382123 RepID=UPI0033C07BFC